MTKKLLLADDSITIQKVIGIIFATEDYQLIICDDGDEAFSKALTEFPDLVIADVSMPGKDGFELCEAIKSEPGLGHTSVLLLPGTFEHFDEGRAETVGADGWLSKPFESQALLDKVRQLLETEPIVLSANDDLPVAAAEEFVEEEVATSLSTAVVDETVLGLDEVDLDGDVADDADSAADIWDAVSFEEDELSPEGGLAEAVVEESVLVEDSGGYEPPADFTPTVEEDADFSFSEDTPLELIDEVAEEAEELFGTAVEDEPLVELVEEGIVEEPAMTLMDGFSDAEENTPFIATESLEEDLPIVEPLSEDSLDAEDEILDLAEEDVLEEEPLVDAPADFGEEIEEPLAVAEELVEEELVEEELVEEELVEEELAGVESIPAEDVFVLEEEIMTAESDALAAAGEDEFIEETVEETVVEFVPSASDEVDSVDDEFVTEASQFDETEPFLESATDAGIVSVEQIEQQLRELSEDELKEIVAKVAGPTIEKLANEMLEKIVWEVVPDLAESMIREEIRKIRQGAE